MFRNIRNYRDLISSLEHTFNKSNLFSIVLIDLDHFHRKKVETHEDNLIQSIYNFLNTDLSLNCIYLGKDEFSILFPEVNLEKAIGTLFEIKNKFTTSMNMTFSASIAEYPKHGEDYVELIRNLEESLFEGKQKERNSISIVNVPKLKLKSNYYSPIQLSRLSNLSKKLNRSEASLLRESLDELIRKYES